MFFEGGLFEPTRNNRNMLRARTTLNNDTSQLMMSYEHDHLDNVEALKEWVSMKESTKPVEIPKPSR